MLDKHAAALNEKKWAHVPQLFNEAKSDAHLKWADFKAVSAVIEAEVVKRVGEREKKGAAKKEEKKDEKPEAGKKEEKVNEEELDASQYRELRMRTVEQMRGAGRDPYPHKFNVTLEIDEFRRKYDSLKVLVLFLFAFCPSPRTDEKQSFLTEHLVSIK